MRPPCERCETLPAELPSEGTVFLSAPEAGTGAHIRRAVAEAGLEAADSLPGLLEVAVPPDTLENLAEAIAGCLTDNQMRDTKCLYLPAGETFSVQALFHMQPLLELVYRARSRWLVEMLREQRLTTYFQPIVKC